VPPNLLLAFQPAEPEGRQEDEMNKFLRVAVALPALLFVVMGLRWVIDPSGAAEGLGMILLDGIGRSSQIGDGAALFLGMGVMILLGLVTAKRSWFYAPAMLLLMVAVFRVVAWLVHDAALATPLIAVEVVIGTLLLFASSRLASND
jgi:hypothetical protein